MAAGARRARSTLGAGGDGGITIIVKVAGSVISERDLVEVVRRGLTRTGTANGTIGGLTRRASPATIHNPRIADTNGGTYVTAQSRSPRLGSAEGKSTSGGSGTLRAPTGKGELGLDAGTIAVIASVLVLAYQARSLATHARIANEVAGAEANRELLTWWHDSVLRVFVEYPETRALLYDASAQPADAAQQVRLQVVSEMAADALQVALETAGRLAPFARYQEPWKEYAEAQVASSSAIRSVVQRMPNAWSALAPLVEAYDRANPPVPKQGADGVGGSSETR